jgi:hypothetical protein
MSRLQIMDAYMFAGFRGLLKVSEVEAIHHYHRASPCVSGVWKWPLTSSCQSR